MHLSRYSLTSFMIDWPWLSTLNWRLKPQPRQGSYHYQFLISMPSHYQIELASCFDLLLHHITDILDNLFFMRLELEADKIPIFMPEPIFNSMETLVASYHWWVCPQFPLSFSSCIQHFQQQHFQIRIVVFMSKSNFKF